MRRIAGETKEEFEARKEQNRIRNAERRQAQLDRKAEKVARRERGRPRFNENFSAWGNTYLKATILLFFVLCLVAAAIILLIAASEDKRYNDRIDDNVAYARYTLSYGPQAHDTSPQMVATRRAFARSNLRANNDLVATYGKGDGILDSSGVVDLQKMSKDGLPIKLNVTYRPTRPYYEWVFSNKGVVAVAAYAAFAILFLLVFASRVTGGFGSPNRRISSLPWDSYWPVPIMVLLGPIVWVVLGVSFLCERRAQRYLAVDNDRQERNRDNDLRARGAYDPRKIPWDMGQAVPLEWERMSEDQQTTNKTDYPSYSSHPKIAQATYVDLRMMHLSNLRERQLANVKTKIRGCRADLTLHAESIKRIQAALGPLQADQKRMEEALNDKTPIGDPTKLREEFERMMKLPGVQAVQVVNDGLRFIVRASYQFHGRTYDLGDWSIVLNKDTSNITADRLRSGVRETWRGDYPVYGAGLFCFGSRQREIDDHLLKGQYLEALALTVECLNSINPSHQRDVPAAFKEVVVSGKND